MLTPGSRTVLCEIDARLRAVGLERHAYQLPITQPELGDATGLSTVHVNRTLQELRGNGLMTTPRVGASSLRIGRACKRPESSTPPTSTSSKRHRPSFRARTLLAISNAGLLVYAA